MKKNTILLLIATFVFSSCETPSSSGGDLIDGLPGPGEVVGNPVIVRTDGSGSNSLDAKVRYKITNLPFLGGGIYLYASSSCNAGGRSDLEGDFSQSGFDVYLNLTFTGTGPYNLGIQTQSNTGAASECIPLSYTVQDVPSVPSFVNSGASNGIASSVNLSLTVPEFITVKAYSDSACTIFIDEDKSSTSRSSFVVEDLALGETDIYLQFENLGGVKSSCSSSFVSYERSVLTPPATLTISESQPSYSARVSVTATGGGVSNSDSVYFYKDSSCTQSLGYGSVSSGSATYSLYSVAQNETLSFYAKARHQSGAESACSTATVSYTRSAVPAPTSIALSGTPSSGNIDLVRVEVQGAIIGKTIYFYSDSSCSTQIGSLHSSQVSSTTVIAELDELREPGAYNIYAKNGYSSDGSACSSSFATFTFSDYATNQQSILSWAENLESFDIDNDEDFDLVVTGGHSLRVYKNDGVGNFTESQLLSDGDGSSNSGQLYSVDLNNDGYLDILHRNYKSIVYFENNKDGTLKNPISIYNDLTQSSDYISIVDMNKDGDLDLVFPNNTNVYIAFGNGNATFQTPSAISSVPSSSKIIVSDIDGDTFLDIVIKSAAKSISYFKNDQAGGFGPAVVISSSSNIRDFIVSDYNSSGSLDIVTVEEGNKLVFYSESIPGVFISDQSILFSASIDTYDFKLKEIDFNSSDDNDKDYLISSSHSFNKEINLIESDGTGGFVNYTLYQEDAGDDIEVNDFNGDGKDDFVVINGDNLALRLQ